MPSTSDSPSAKRLRAARAAYKNRIREGQATHDRSLRRLRRHRVYSEDTGELLTEEFDEGNDDLDDIQSSLGVASKRRPACE